LSTAPRPRSGEEANRRERKDEEETKELFE
jgi:hypothetical protein